MGRAKQKKGVCLGLCGVCVWVCVGCVCVLISLCEGLWGPGMWILQGRGEEEWLLMADGR